MSTYESSWELRKKRVENQGNIFYVPSRFMTYYKFYDMSKKVVKNLLIKKCQDGVGWNRFIW